MSAEMIRRATADDWESLAEFNIAMAAETENIALLPEVVAAGVMAVLNSPGREFYLVCQVGDLVVASLLITTEWSDWRNGDWWWIQSVYVPKEHRRKGVFSALYRHVEALAKQTDGVVGLRLFVERENTNAQATYTALGMKDEGYRLFYARTDGGE